MKYAGIFYPVSDSGTSPELRVARVNSKKESIKNLKIVDMADLKLFVVVDDYTALKVQVVASVANVSLQVEKNVSPSQLQSLEAAAKTSLLQTVGGNLTQHIAILRYLAGLNPSLNLLGTGDIDRAQVDQWLEFSWQELGIRY